MKEREDTIRFDMNYCQHYKSGRKITCLAGVDVEKKFDVETPGMFNRMPCVGGHKKFKDPCGECEHWVRRTREMGEKRADAIEKMFNDATILMPIISKWRKQKPIGKRETIECPVCKGNLNLSQAASNGHVHGKCETDGCFNWME